MNCNEEYFVTRKQLIFYSSVVMCYRLCHRYHVSVTNIQLFIILYFILLQLTIYLKNYGRFRVTYYNSGEVILTLSYLMWRFKNEK